MIQTSFKQRPVVYYILCAVCLIILAGMVISLIQRFNFEQDFPGQIVRISFWTVICTGFLLVKKWAWGIFTALISFSLLNILHSMLLQRMDFSLFPILSILSGVAIIWGLNTQAIRNLFQINIFQGKDISVNMVYMALVCITLGFFLLIEVLGISRMGGSSIPARVFISFLGCIYILVGIGVWRLNSYALLSVFSVLVFTLVSIIIIAIYDFIEVQSFLATRRYAAYLLVVSGIIWYWLNMVRPHVKPE